jgi:phytol kinase
MLLWIEVVKFLGHFAGLPNWQQRKLMHIFTGPIFILTWPYFDDGSEGSIWAVMVPLVMTLKFYLVGKGYLTDNDMVRTSSRTGKREELLKGPLYYGLIFILSTVFFWKSVNGIIYLFILCFGDGMAEVVGRLLGQGNPIPWNPRKSVAGTIGFMVFAYLATLLFLKLYGPRIFGHHSPELYDVERKVLFDVIIGGFIETLPIEDFDNISVFASIAIFDMCRNKINM